MVVVCECVNGTGGGPYPKVERPVRVAVTRLKHVLSHDSKLGQLVRRVHAVEEFHLGSLIQP